MAMAMGTPSLETWFKNSKTSPLVKTISLMSTTQLIILELTIRLVKLSEQGRLGRLGIAHIEDQGPNEPSKS